MTTLEQMARVAWIGWGDWAKWTICTGCVEWSPCRAKRSKGPWLCLDCHSQK